jgi:hypothetical protein
MARVSELNSIHIPVVAELRLWIKPEWRFFHCPNGVPWSAKMGAKQHAMGVLPGVPDLILMSPRSAGSCEYFLEFKLPGKTLSEAQEDFRMWAICRGSPYVVAYSQSDAFRAFNEWDCWRLTQAIQTGAAHGF